MLLLCDRHGQIIASRDIIIRNNDLAILNTTHLSTALFGCSGVVHLEGEDVVAAQCKAVPTITCPL